ncbi:MAG TPA: hypothetical protein VGH81_00455 [Rudaea sp.]|jgi:hypothetical protein
MATNTDHTTLLIALSAAYCIASLVHFVHNAEYLAQYPNMPPWLSRSKVYVSWLGITAVGALGLAFVRSRYAAAGLVLIAVYAAFGFDGLGHYALAPISAHTLAMNLSIWFEVVAAAALLFVALRGLLRRLDRSRLR